MSLKVRFTYNFIKFKNRRIYYGILLCTILNLILVYYLLRSSSVDSHEDYYSFGQTEFSESEECRTGLEFSALIEAVERRNVQHDVRNLQHGPVTRDTPVLCVLARRGPARLQRLLATLQRVRDIRSALLVVSHSCIDDGADRLVKSVTFSMVLQLYYPHSVQLYPNIFPGPDERDEPPEPGAEPRAAQRSEGKHHWWWTAHQVFNGMPWASRHRAPVLFLREDSVVLPDLLHVLRHATAALALAPAARLVSLGRPRAGHLDLDKLTLDRWRPPHDLGLAFNRSVWLQIAALAEPFCDFSDTSWAYSLLAAFSSRGGAPAMVASVAPRVLAAGEWTDGEAGAGWLHAAARDPRLFPSPMRLVQLWERGGCALRPAPPPLRAVAAAGWDVRDMLLCLEHYATEKVEDTTTRSPFFTFPPTTIIAPINITDVHD